MYYQLIPLSGTQSRESGWRLDLPATVGRGSEASLCIDDESISRSHCQIYLAPDESLQVRDLGSTNGTYVNGERIRQHHSLFPGDVLQIGGLTLKVHYESDTDPGSINPLPRNPSSNKTMQMPTVQSPTFTMHEVPMPTKKWWEFWKS
ncbi:FHA domain-containing protein [Pirellulaceae bacterium SH449]